MSKLFNGEVAIVTGASSGIGRASAIEFSKEGAKVVVADVLEKEANETVEMIRKMGGEALFVRCDVSNPNDVEQMVKKTITTFGRLDAAFNNAGIEGEQAFTMDCTLENWDHVININLKGVWLCMKYEIAEMMKQKKGAIVNCSSVAGLVGFPGIPAYVASKHGVVGLSKTAALEYAKHGIRVNAVCPGVIKTPMIDRFTHGSPEAVQQLIKIEPVGRMGGPEEVAALAVWLCSDKASFITGYPYAVDGGFVAE
jgi:NAD(P)-dependent dehydrogenase (short-subunit alcohol dehydrogenase family)